MADEPAVCTTTASGRQEWRLRGVLHRGADLPAVVWPGGTREWLVNGQRHRSNNNPAIVYSDGSCEWWVNGRLHQSGDMPARICWDGSREWWVNGQRHRENFKPAVVRFGGQQEWWYRNVRLPCGNFDENKDRHAFVAAVVALALDGGCFVQQHLATCVSAVLADRVRVCISPGAGAAKPWVLCSEYATLIALFL